jgi:DNA uptake protein ComE-like DNA-binding protein
MMKFLAGVGAGFGVGLMLAPEKGSATRKKIVERFETTANRLGESAAPIVNAVSEQVERFVDSSKASLEYVIGGNRKDESSQLLEILNSASKTKLMTVSGIGDATARHIIEARPYSSPDQVVGNGVLSEAIMTTLKKTLLVEDEAA